MTDSRPNVLFLFTDQQRPDWLGTNPSVPVRTPNVEGLADRGVQFTNAVCPTPLCNPCRASIASGFEYDRAGVPSNQFDYPLDRPTYQGRLRDEGGYHVTGCGKFDLRTRFSLGLSGDDGVERWGYSAARFNPAKNNTVRSIREDPTREPRDPYTAYLAEEGLLEAHVEDYERRYDEGVWTATFPTPLPDEAYYDEWITRAGLGLIDDAPDDRPWFLDVNLQNPHDPWDVTEEMHGWYRDPDVDFPEPVDPDPDVAAETHQEVRRNYASMVEHLDRCVGRFVDRLEERGELEDTLIVFASDHGEMLGDRGQWAKTSPYRASVGVPLVVAGPNVADRDPVDAPVTTLDLHATFLEVAGVEPADGIDSRSMRGFLAGETDDHRDVVYSGVGPWRMVFDGTYKLVRGYEPDFRRGTDREPDRTARENARRRQREREPILWDVPAGERENVADRHPDVVDDLTAALESIRDRAAP